MELHSSPTVGKKLWNVLRVAFFMMRKGLISKRKLIMDINLMMQRGKLLSKTFAKNLTRASDTTPSGFGPHEYEFSCTNSPNPVFFRVKHCYFPCMGPTAVDDRHDSVPGPAVAVPRIEYGTPRSSVVPSPLSVRVSNYSTAEEGDGVGGEVDNRAEEFIRRFYQQLSAQGRVALLEYQEEQYREMLARGA